MECKCRSADKSRDTARTASSAFHLPAKRFLFEHDARLINLANTEQRQRALDCIAQAPDFAGVGIGPQNFPLAQSDRQVNHLLRCHMVHSLISSSKSKPAPRQSRKPTVPRLSSSSRHSAL